MKQGSKIAGGNPERGRVENDYNYALWLWKQSNSTTKTKRAVQSLIDKRNKNVII